LYFATVFYLVLFSIYGNIKLLNQKNRSIQIETLRCKESNNSIKSTLKRSGVWGGIRNPPNAFLILFWRQKRITPILLFVCILLLINSPFTISHQQNLVSTNSYIICSNNATPSTALTVIACPIACST